MTGVKGALAYVQEVKGGPLSLERVDVGAPGPFEVLIEMHAAGVCQSQIHYMNSPRSEPILLGHEGYGEVLAVGDSVTKLKVGDLALVTWIPDQRTDLRTPSTARATFGDARSAVSPSVYCWSTHAVLDEKYLVPLADPAMATAEMSIVGCAVPTGVGAVRNAARLRPGAHVAVIGLGGVGLSVVRGAALAGAARIWAVDISEDKRELAQLMGATDFVLSGPDAAAQIHDAERSGQRPGVDVAFDCVAREQTIASAIQMARNGVPGRDRGGKVVIVGVPSPTIPVDLVSMFRGEKGLLTTMGGSTTHDDLEAFTRLGADGALKLSSLVTDHYAFTDIPAAVEELAAGRVKGRAVVTF